jgi:hypothetical protein
MRKRQLLALFVVLNLLTACASSGSVRRESDAPVGSPCTGAWVSDTDGVIVFKFGGSVVGRQENGSLRPIEAATFHLVYGTQREKLPFTTNRSGQFRGEILLSSYHGRRCKGGKVEGGTVVGRAEIAIGAKSCTEAQLILDSTWKPRPIELVCEHGS